MFRFLDKFKIPTLLGLSLILLGTIGGVYLTLHSQTTITKASPNLNPQNIKLTNVDFDSATISWITDGKTTGFLTFGINLTDKVALDDRDEIKPNPRDTHYVTLKELKPGTTYIYKITSGQQVSQVSKFTTAKELGSKNEFQPVIGSVTDEKTPLNDGIAYLEIAAAAPQSALIKNLGNFIIPISSIRTQDLNSFFTINEDTTATITVYSGGKQAKASFGLFSYLSNPQPLGPLIIDQDLNLITTPTPTPTGLLDLNGDGFVNSSDYAIVLKNFGKSPQDKRADINGDGVVDKLDLDIISKEVFKPAR